MRRLALSCGIVVIIVATLLPASAQAVSACTFESQVHITPGVTPTPSPGTFATPEPGTITCHGAIEGSGTIEYHGVTGTLGGGESCVFDVGGTGTLTYVINDVTTTGDFTFGRLVAAGGFTGNAGAGTINGLFEFQPASGQDCVTTPITDATVTGQAIVVY